MNKDDILAKLAAGEISTDEASKLLEETEQAKRGLLFLQGESKGCHQCLRATADARDAASGTMGTAARLWK